MPHVLSLAVVVAGLLAALCSIAAAQVAGDAATPSRIGGAKDWEAFSYAEKGGKVCYLVGHPAKSEPASLKRGRIDAIVTHRPKENALNVVNFNVGYPFKEGASAELDIDGRKFALFTQKDSAWASDSETDKAVTEALAKGKRALLKGASARGAATTDTYALDGFKETLAAIDKTCGVKR
jgi:hypothetical protein